MHTDAAAACKKHVDRALADVLGNRTFKIVSVNNVTNPEVNRGMYTCYCGKPADFYVHERKENGTPQNYSPKKKDSDPNRVNARGTSAGHHG